MLFFNYNNNNNITCIIMRNNNNNKLKAFVRFSGDGRIISSSLIVQAFKPKVGNWKEIDAKECCNYTTTTTTTLPV